jgi:ABC-type Mn2+/Zn2+ transport system permease subunit
VSWITAPFEFAFFPRALLAGTLVGAMCGSLGVFVVLRRMSYIGHGLSQSILGGVAVALLVGQGLYVGAAAATLLSAVLINWVGRRPGLHTDAGIGIVSTAMFALGVVVLSANRGLEVNMSNLLFGNVLGVTNTDLAVLGVVAAAVAAMLFVLFKPLVFATVDLEVASAHGVRTTAMEIAFNAATAAVVVVSVRVVGVLLIAAALVVPAAAARLVMRSFGPLVAVAALTGAAASLVGLYVSYYANLASGPSIVLTATAAFAVVAAVTTGTASFAHRRARHASRGLAWPWWRG